MDNDDLDARIFAATQAKDEARHVMAIRELVARVGPIYDCGPILHHLLDVRKGRRIRITHPATSRAHRHAVQKDQIVTQHDSC